MPSANTTEAIDGLTTAVSGMSDVFLLIALIIIPVILTFLMFHSRSFMLGFPCVIFWAILGGYCYTLSASTWDIHYFIFFASFGMVIFTMLGAYGLRKEDMSEPDIEEGKVFDEEKEPDVSGGAKEEETSPRSQRVRDRADNRRKRRRGEL